MNRYTCPRCGCPDLPREAFGSRGPGRHCLECENAYRQLARHGITASDRQDRAADQDGCALCGRLEPGRKGWVIDHDRTCCPGDQSCASCRRGVLCQWCNNALGYAFDDPKVLRRMALYIELGTRLVPTCDPTRDSQQGLAAAAPTNVRNGPTEKVGTVISSLTTLDADARTGIHGGRGA